MSGPGRTPVFVVLAVFRPDPVYLEAQLRSLAGQTHPVERVVAVIADRVSRDLVDRFCQESGLPVDLVVPPDTLRSYRSFEAGLERAIKIAPESAVIALCDQDDIWRRDKIALGVRALSETDVSLVHSDAEVIDAEGARLHPSLARLERRKRRATLRDLLIRNTDAGADWLYRRAAGPVQAARRQRRRRGRGGAPRAARGQRGVAPALGGALRRGLLSCQEPLSQSVGTGGG